MGLRAGPWGRAVISVKVSCRPDEGLCALERSDGGGDGKAQPTDCQEAHPEPYPRHDPDPHNPPACPIPPLLHPEPYPRHDPDPHNPIATPLIHALWAIVDGGTTLTLSAAYVIETAGGDV